MKTCKKLMELDKKIIFHKKEVERLRISLKNYKRYKDFDGFNGIKKLIKNEKELIKNLIKKMDELFKKYREERAGK